MITLNRFLNSWKNNVSSELKSTLISDYRLEIWQNSDREIYIIESSTNSGIQINSDKSFIFVLSGVYEFNYYDSHPIMISKDEDLKKSFDDVFSKESINKDRLINVLIFLEDICTRDRIETVKEGEY